MSADLEALAFRTITHGQPLGDEELKLIDPALDELIGELRTNRQQLPSAFLAGFTPLVTIENPVLSRTHIILRRHWKGLIKLYPTPPVWLLRYVLVIALIRLLDQDETSVSVAALTLDDLHAHLNDKTERELRTDILAQLTSCSLSFEGEKCVLEGVQRIEFQLECLTTHFRDEREPYGSRQLAPVRPRPRHFRG